MRRLTGILGVVGACVLLASCVDLRTPDTVWRGRDEIPDLGFGFVVDLGPPPHPPEFGPTVLLDVPPPPISGGTLAVVLGGSMAVASDPDHDRIALVDLDHGTLVASVVLAKGDEPGRVVADGAGRVHVVLRGGDAIADVAVPGGALLGRRSVCSLPRGIAYDAGGDRLWVACAGGELIALPAAGGPSVVNYRLDRGLRDVVVAGQTLFVSLLRSAEVLIVDARTGTVSGRRRPSQAMIPNVHQGAPFSPAVAWRMVPDHRGGVLLAHQRGLTVGVAPSQGGYGGGQSNCDTAIVQSVVSRLSDQLGANAPAAPLRDVVLPVDIALSPDGTEVAIAAAGNAHAKGAADVIVYPLASLQTPTCAPPHHDALAGAQAVAVAYRPDGKLVVQTRAPAAVRLLTGGAPSITLLGGDLHADTGHDIFHSDAGAGLACASCHPEGGEDGRVWQFQGSGRAPHPAAAWRPAGPHPLSLGRRVRRPGRAHPRRLHLPHERPHPAPGAAGGAGPLPRQHPRAARPRRRPRRRRPRQGHLRGPAGSGLRPVSPGSAPRQQRARRRGHARRVQGAVAHQPRLARALHARRLRGDAGRAFRQQHLRRDQSRLGGDAHARGPHRPHRVPRQPVITAPARGKQRAT